MKQQASKGQLSLAVVSYHLVATVLEESKAFSERCLSIGILLEYYYSKCTVFLLKNDFSSYS